MSQESAMVAAIQEGDVSKVRDLLGKEPGLVNSKTESGLPAVLLALYYGRSEIAEMLVERGAALDIFSAAAMGLLARVKELTSPETVNAISGDGFQPLGLAAFFGHVEVAQFLVEQGAEVNSASRNPMQVMPLHSAVAGGHVEVARILLQAGADPNARQADDFVPLHGAAQNGQPEMIRLLLDYGADPSLNNKNGKTVLDFARESGSKEAVALLA